MAAASATASANSAGRSSLGGGVDPVAGQRDGAGHHGGPLRRRGQRRPRPASGTSRVTVHRRRARARLRPWSCSRRTGTRRAARPRRPRAASAGAAGWPPASGSARPPGPGRPAPGPRRRRPGDSGLGAGAAAGRRRAEPTAATTSGDPGGPSVATLVTSPAAPVAPSRASVSVSLPSKARGDALRAGGQQRTAVRSGWLAGPDDDRVDGQLGGVGVGEAKGQLRPRCSVSGRGDPADASGRPGRYRCRPRSVTPSRRATRPAGSCHDCRHDRALLHSPLHDRHVALGAKFAAFGGWEMPLEYAGGGVLKEHAAVREAVGVFDVSHLGKARVRGPGAADFVNVASPTTSAGSRPGQAQYTLCCDDATGGVVDDLIAYLLRRRPRLPDPERGQHRRGGPAAGRGRAGGCHGHRRARDVRACSPCRARGRPSCSAGSGCRPTTTT